MPPSDGWYLLGPFIAVSLVGFLGAIFWRMGLQWHEETREDPLRDLYDGLAIFHDHGDDFGLLCPAAATDDADLADEIKGVLATAGIRSTSAVRPDGRVLVLVFPEEVEEARRLVL
ncbi:hypothetical protein GCM10010435_13960 [Winogradskya consettensis]|uniref:Uncharacterized protein n=1 Tax=Winogradskya consettensis TaxID=113560 RepID=A0A919SC90_9ACTN|nr:hypothetical protein [Actinoplanes consettensis]GIM68994.1 hypothetical protein Aco04nite_13230 [Actinoplanes consettensis]